MTDTMGTRRGVADMSKQVIGGAVLLGAYYVVARLSLRLAFPGTNVSPIWPPSGVAVAGLLLGGRRLWPALTVGAFLANLTTGLSAYVSACIAVGNTVEYVVAAALLAHFGFRSDLDRLRDATLMVTASVLSPVAAASVGQAALWSGGVVPAHRIPVLWLTWWLGDAAGIVIATPFILLIVEILRGRAVRIVSPTLGAGCAVLVAASAVNFLTPYRYSFFVLFPIAVLLAMATGQSGAIIGGLIVAGLSLWGTTHGTGPFGTGSSLDDRLIRLQEFAGSFSATVILVAGSASDKRRAAAEAVESAETLAAEQLAAAQASAVALAEKLAAQMTRERLELELEQSRRLTSFGQLAGGIAHDFNNLLGAIGAVAGNAADRLEEHRREPADPAQGSTAPAGADTEEREHALAAIAADLGDIASAVGKGATMTRQLMAVARHEASGAEVTDVNAVVSATAGTISPVMGPDVSLRLNCSPDVPRVLLDPGQLEHMIINMCLNSRDAMPGGGEIVIGTRSLESMDDPVPAEPSRARAVEVSVSDTGEGMTPEVSARAYEPFFTTKAPGAGTGLGLSSVFGFVERSGGKLDIETAPGKGTTMRALFPAVAPVDE